MVNLLESMHKCCLPSGVPSESPSAYEKSLVHKIFGGRLRSQVNMSCLAPFLLRVLDNWLQRESESQSHFGKHDNFFKKFFDAERSRFDCVF